MDILLICLITIALHEGAHFLSAIYFGVKVEKFCIFFDPWFSIIKFKIKDVQISIGWIILGGYVILSGFMDNKALNAWDFETKAKYQKIVILLAGVIVNITTGVIFLCFRSNFFILLSHFSIIMGLINIMPFKGFDGYYVFKILINKNGNYILNNTK